MRQIKPENAVVARIRRSPSKLRSTLESFESNQLADEASCKDEAITRKHIHQGVVFVFIGMLMSRASIRITFALLSSFVVAACGGGGGDGTQNSGADQESTVVASTAPSNSSSASCSDSIAASGQITMSLEEIPYCDPAPLEEMMAMDDASYQNQLSNHWTDVEKLLHRYIPPNVTVYPAPRNFIGAMDSCLQLHGLSACREYMNQLIGLNKGKQP